MAPPNNRRTGFSKRAQYNVFYAYLAGIVGVVLGGALLFASLTNHTAFSGLRGVAADAAQICIPRSAGAGEVKAATHLQGATPTAQLARPFAGEVETNSPQLVVAQPDPGADWRALG